MQSNYGKSTMAGKSIRRPKYVAPRPFRPVLRVAAFILLTGLAWSGFAAPAWAQSPQADLALARSLREHSMPDLAVELLQRPETAPAGAWKAAFAIERARARTEHAEKVNRALAIMLLDSAERDLQAAAQDTEAQVLAPVVRFEQARLQAARGRWLLERQTANGAKLSTRERKQIQGIIQEAGRALEAFIVPQQNADPVLAASEDGDLELRLTFERGRNDLDLSRSLIDSTQASERAKAMRLAVTRFSSLARKDANLPIRWTAMAWLYACHLDNDDPKAARKAFTDLTSAKNRAADNGKRLIKALRLLWLIRENDARTQATLAAECEDWLHLYPDEYDSTIGWQLRTYLARNAYAQVATIGPKTALNAKQREALERALRFAADVDLPDRDEAGTARNRRLQIAELLSPELKSANMQKLASAYDGWLRAQVDFASLSSAPANDTPEDRKRRLEDLQALLSQILARPDVSRFPREATECRMLLAYCFYMSGDMARAADEGEALARKQTHSATAAQAGNLALQALAALMARDVAQTAESIKQTPLRSRFHSLAQFLIHTWEFHPQADSTRHLLGLALGREKQFAQALEQIEALSPGYSDLPRACYQGASLALEAEKAKTAPPAGALAYRDRAVRLLEKMPAPASGHDARMLQTIFACKRLLIEMDLQAKRWDDLNRAARETIDSFQELDNQAKESFRIPLLSLQLFACCIESERSCEAGQYHAAREALAPALASIRDSTNESILENLKLTEPAILSRFLDLSIRTAVLDDQMKIAQEQLELLTKLFPDNPLDLLGATIQILGEQIGSLRKQGDSAKEKLDKMATSVGIFLDSLADQQKSSPKPESLLFLAQSYASIEQFDRASQLAGRIEPPAPDKRDDARAQQVYRAAQVLLLRCLRQRKSWKEAETLAGQLQATPWGPSSLDLKKEKLLLLQDQGKLAGRQGAILGWNSFLMQLQPRLQDNRLREIYFDGYYQLTYCIYRNALQQGDVAAKKKELKLAANYILKLDSQSDPVADPCKKRLHELLTDAAPLREQYNALKKEEQR